MAVKDRWDNRPWLQRLGDSVSQLANVLLLNGMPDESISGRAWRNTALRRPPRRRWWVARLFAEALFWPIDRGQHCRLAYEQDIERARLRWVAAVQNARLDVSQKSSGARAVRLG
ncbi:MAG: hypothetical protein KatS3mg127_1255 [Silanimonas sp.]|jgi:GrpB-like predicted nucleotidyltransferase (UPF0157 family)|nr:MAG: hypothetical protein KatS3mg127_1255 [Silanimonas sp.]